MHPVEQLFSEMSIVAPYPDGVIGVPDRIPGIAFFPGGAGLWGAKPDAPLPEMPVGGIMVLGHDFHSESGFRASLAQRTEFPDSPRSGYRTSPTWTKLLKLFDEAGVSRERCFFTNAYMGLRQGDGTMGVFPGSYDSGFVDRCQGFFRRQVEVVRPSVILSLGIQVPRFIAPLSPELGRWAQVRSFSELDKAGAIVQDVSFGDDLAPRCTVTALTHPSMRLSNVRHRRYAGLEGHMAELRLLLDAKASLKADAEARTRSEAKEIAW